MIKLKNYIAIVILIFSWFALYWITGSKTPWTEFNNASNDGGIRVHLGDVPASNYDRMGFTKGVVRHIQSEDAWLVGTERGELFLFNNKGKQLWKRSLGIGKLISLCISNDGTIAYVGEASPEGNLYAINITSGDVLWKCKASDYVGSETSKRSHPSIVHIVVDKDDNVYANAYRFLMTETGKRAYNAKMLALSKKGKMLWQFPKKEGMDSWINWCDVNDANNSVVIATSAYDFRDKMRYKDTLYFLDKVSGENINSIFVEPIVPFNNTVMRGSPNFSKDGKYLAAACSDGRGILFDGNGNVLWQHFVSKPTQIDGVWINASGRDGFVVDDKVLFTTINTFNKENWQLPTPVNHPSSNSLFVFDLAGGFKYQFRTEGTMEEIDFAGDLVACAIGRNVRTHNYAAHGALIIDLQEGKQKNFYRTEGPCQAIAISDDGSKMAGIEAPALTPQGKVLGAYRLHIWDLEK